MPALSSGFSSEDGTKIRHALQAECCLCAFVCVCIYFLLGNGPDSFCILLSLSLSVLMSGFIVAVLRKLSVPHPIGL